MEKDKFGKWFLNILGVIGIIYILYVTFFSETRYQVFFYRLNNLWILRSFFCLLIIIPFELLLLREKKHKGEYIRKRWRAVGVVWVFLAVLIFMPIALYLIQKSTEFQPKGTTIGTVIKKEYHQINIVGRSMRYQYPVFLIAVSSVDGVKYFDLRWNSKGIFYKAKIGQYISIKHYGWIRDDFLDIQLE